MSSTREEIEKVLIEQNIYHQKKVLNTQAYNDKIYKTLLEDTVRDRILNRKLKPEQCTNKDVYEFLTLLRRATSSTK